MTENKMDWPQERSLGAGVVFRTFNQKFHPEWENLRDNNITGSFVTEVAEWIPTLVNYYDESPPAKSSLEITERVLRLALEKTDLQKAVLIGIQNAAARVPTKTRPAPNFYDQFLKHWRSKSEFQDKFEKARFLGLYALDIIFKHDGSFPADLAMGIVKSTLKDEGDPQLVENYVRGILCGVLVRTDFPQVRDWLTDNSIGLLDTYD